MNELAQDIGTVRDYIDEHGWVQTVFFDNHGAVCLAGAINRAGVSDREAVFRAVRMACNKAGSLGSGGEESIFFYNDAVLKHKQEALDFLDKLRITLEEQA